MFSEPQFPRELELNYKTIMGLYEIMLVNHNYSSHFPHAQPGLGMHNNLMMKISIGTSTLQRK